MRPIVLALAAFALAACGETNKTTEAAPAATPAPAAVADAPAAPAPAPEAPAKPPEGECGDQSATPADQRLANTPKWTLASEQDNFGFDVYRGDTEEGEFTKLTKDPVIGAGTTDETQRYQFRDDTIDPCKAYWYYIESISTAGVREKFTPTFQAPAKRSPKTDAAP